MSLTKEHTLEVIEKCRAAQLAADDDRYMLKGDVSELPIATAAILGGVKVGQGLKIDSDSGVISVSNGKGLKIDSDTGVVSLAAASCNTIGGVKVPNNVNYGLTINSDTGVVTLNAADRSIGGVKSVSLDRRFTDTATISSGVIKIPSAHNGSPGTVFSLNTRTTDTKIENGTIYIPKAHNGGAGTVDRVETRTTDTKIENGTIYIPKAHNGGTGTVDKVKIGGTDAATISSGTIQIPYANNRNAGAVKIQSNTGLEVNTYTGVVSLAEAEMNTLGGIRGIRMVDDNVQPSISSGVIQIPMAHGKNYGLVGYIIIDGTDTATISSGIIRIPYASSVKAGAVKIGTGLSVSSAGVIGVPRASADTLGVVKIGDNIAVNNGTISIKPATDAQFGVVKVGDNISFSQGTISLSAANVTNALGYVPPAANLATSTSDGLMSAADKTIIDGIAVGAQSNVIEVIKVNDTALPVDSDKAVNIDLSAYALKSELGSGQVTLGTDSVNVEGALWLSFS